jgi:pyrroloquinoline-quinone synthase
MFIEKLRAGLAAKHLLNHEFYQLWSEGKLDQEILADYSKQYYKHVEAFPRYISLIHSQCNDLNDRQILLENLIEEERGEENHPKLWRDFAIELGVSAFDLLDGKQYKTTEYVVNKFFDLCRQSYAAGLGALYAYEYQTPAVADSKIKGLKAFYNIDSEKALKFFEVHKGADIWHSEEVGALIEKLSPDAQAEAFEAAAKAADALWGFLDGMMIAHNLHERRTCIH